jgi:hypothetical protein
MNYEQKYLKYKQKYLNLKAKEKVKAKANTNANTNPKSYTNQSSKEILNNFQFGGAESIIPSGFPGTYSFLFMPLLYYTLDNSSVTLPVDFEQIVNECIANIREMGIKLRFNDFTGFIQYLRTILVSHNIESIENILKLQDGPYHIPGEKQEEITNYNTDSSIAPVISCIAQMLIERKRSERMRSEKMRSEKFIYNV